MTRLIKYRPRVSTTRIILHDSHTVPDIESIPEVPRWRDQAWDKGLKMGLLDVGYHFIIERDAKVVETRDRHLIGTHTPGHNLDSIGICLVGGRELGIEGGVNNFLKVQIDALFDLIFNLRTELGFIKMVGHSEVQRYRNRLLPDCPAMEMDDLRQDLDIYTFKRKRLEAQDAGREGLH